MGILAQHIVSTCSVCSYCLTHLYCCVLDYSVLFLRGKCKWHIFRSASDIKLKITHSYSVYEISRSRRGMNSCACEQLRLWHTVLSLPGTGPAAEWCSQARCHPESVVIPTASAAPYGVWFLMHKEVNGNITQWKVVALLLLAGSLCVCTTIYTSSGTCPVCK